MNIYMATGVGIDPPHPLKALGVTGATAGNGTVDVWNVTTGGGSMMGELAAASNVSETLDLTLTSISSTAEAGAES